MGLCGLVCDADPRAIVRWTTVATKTTTLVSKALNMAVWRCGHCGHPIELDLIHHSDTGSNHTALQEGHGAQAASVAAS
ncbi:hypothetical protein NONI108955_43890 [Nocardia ninae]|uniref:Uncharacterized protein n=1 Tax=Nocardia ninae NBRC 108245 TaxID=1210091 RepID=A0A511MIK8_9NOCA|nr:hypothetical protein NN4_49280 [Nocardia ninae NBRC 108245]